MKNSYIEKLRKVVSDKYEAFINELEKEDPKTIMRKSYEKVFKEEITELLGDYDVDDDGTVSSPHITEDYARALLEYDDPLNELFEGWLYNMDNTYIDRLSRSIWNHSEKLYYKRAAALDTDEGDEI